MQKGRIPCGTLLSETQPSDKLQKDTALDGAIDGLELALNLKSGIGLLAVDDNVAHGARGLEVLGDNVDVPAVEHAVDAVEDARNALVDVQVAVDVALHREGHLGEVDCGQGRSVVGVLDQLVRNLDSDVLLRFLGGCADVRSEDDVVILLQPGDERIVSGGRLNRMDVESGAGDMLGVKRVSESVDVDNGSAGCVDENDALLHLGELGLRRS